MELSRQMILGDPLVLKWFKICTGVLVCCFLVVGVLLCMLPHPQPLSAEEVAAMKAQMAARKKNAPDEKPDKWQLSKRSAHPAAQKLLDEDWYWNITDEDSPFGNDDGGDALVGFHSWRKDNPKLPATLFVEETALQWGAPLAAWKALAPGPSSISPTSPDGFVLQSDDQMIIGTAFAQLALEGKIDTDLRDLAVKAIQNEQSAPLMARWIVPLQRSERLAKMRKVLDKCASTPEVSGVTAPNALRSRK